MTDIFTKADAILAGIYKDYLKFFKYLGVGMVGTIADWAVFFVLIGALDILPMYAVAMSYFVGMVINFFLNKYYTFNNTYKKIHFQFISFALVALVGLGLTEVLLYVFTQYIFDSPSDLVLMVSRVIVTFIVFVYNYIVNKRTTFKIFQ